MSPLGKLKSGEVVVDREVSHIHSDARYLLEDALSKIEFPKNLDRYVAIVEYDHVIGKSRLVKVDEGDKIFYAQRQNRTGLSKLVKDREAEDCKSVTVVLEKSKSDKNKAVLMTIYIGEPAPNEPYDKQLSAEEIEYWKQSALVPVYDELVEGTVTDEPPEYWVL